MKYKTVIFFIFSIIFSILPIKSYSKEVKEILNQMPIEEKQALTRLFYSLVQNDHLGYTLFGEKPVTLSSHFVITPLGNILAKCRCEGVFWNRWKLWKKYEHLLGNNYLIIEENHSDNRASIFFINKSSFINTVNRHHNIFRKFLGNDVNPHILLQKIIEEKKFMDTIKHNQALLGILLGYGVRNGFLFSRREEIRPFFSKKKLPQLITKEPLPSKQFSCLKEEYDYLNAHLKLFDESNYSPLLMQSIYFMADPVHPETLSLKRKYKRLQGKISAIYAQGDFLEITLNEIAK